LLVRDELGRSKGTASMPVKQSDRVLVTELVTRYCDRSLADLATAPPAVRAELTKLFKLLPAEVTEADIANLERQLPAPLPPLFVAYLTCGAFSGVEWAEYALPPIPVGEGLATVCQYMLDDSARSLWQCGYMQFTSGPCGDPVCFDTQQSGPRGDYPVVVFNHDLIPHEAWRERGSLRPHAQQVAGSFGEFLAFLCSGRLPSGEAPHATEGRTNA
jgi:hypothetical protein